MFEIATAWLTRPELGRVDLEPDQEHVEDQAEVRRHPEGRQDVGGEECGLETRCDRAQDRRTERDSGHDLAHHSRLAELHREPAEQARHEHDHGGGDQERRDGMAERLALFDGGDLLAGGRQARQGSRRIVLRLVERDELEVVEVAVDGLRLEAHAAALEALHLARDRSDVAVVGDLAELPPAGLDRVGVAAAIELEGPPKQVERGDSL